MPWFARSCVFESGEDEYEREAPTATNDRACAPITECIESDNQVLYGEAVPTDGSALEDNICCFVYVGSVQVANGAGWPDMSDRDEACFVIDGSLNIGGAGARRIGTLIRGPSDGSAVGFEPPRSFAPVIGRTRWRAG